MVLSRAAALPATRRRRLCCYASNRRPLLAARGRWQRAPEGSDWRDEAALIERGQLGLYRQRVGLNLQAPVEMPSDDEFLTVMASLPRRAT